MSVCLCVAVLIVGGCNAGRHGRSAAALEEAQVQDDVAAVVFVLYHLGTGRSDHLASDFQVCVEKRREEKEREGERRRTRE